MTIATLGAMDESLGVVVEMATVSGAFVAGGVCLFDSSEERAFWDLDGKHIQRMEGKVDYRPIGDFL
jgi:hypothetical protein